MVQRELGPGFLEGVYEEALALELETQGVPFQRQYLVSVNYKGKAVGEGRLDFLVNRRLIVELKVVDTLLPIHTAQVISYLKTTRLKFGLLINFNVPMLTKGVRRVVLD